MSPVLFASHFNTIDEPSQAGKITYPLFDVLFLTVAAVVVSAEGVEVDSFHCLDARTELGVALHFSQAVGYISVHL